MKLRNLKLALAGVFLAGGLRTAFASETTVTTAETSKVVFENEKMRVIEYQSNAGKTVCGLGEHTHPAHLYIMLTPGKFRITTPDGKEEIVDGKAGEVGWEPAVTHRVECIAGENVHCYLVESKDKAWKPSTGTPGEAKLQTPTSKLR